MADAHSEIELKFAAEGVDTGGFIAFCMAQCPSRYVRVVGPDVYWTQGGNVVRHRHDKTMGAAGELTVKRRRSAKDTFNRLEIDLRFADGTTIEDVEQFLTATGWKEAMTIVKAAHIFWYEDKCPVTVVIYNVGRVKDGSINEWRRFVEIEAEKGTDATVDEAKAAVNDWHAKISKRFALGRPLNDSLWELYSGKRYGMAKAGTAR